MFSIGFQLWTLIAHTDAFHSLSAHVYVRNYDLMNGCDFVLLMTQAGPEHMGTGTCKPFCGMPSRCALQEAKETDTDLAELIFNCSCSPDHCNGLAVAVLQRDNEWELIPLEICHVHIEFI